MRLRCKELAREAHEGHSFNSELVGSGASGVEAVSCSDRCG